MKTANTLLLSGILVLSFSGAGLYAQAPAQNPPQAPAKSFRPSREHAKEHLKEATQSYDGTIEQIDKKTGWVTVKQSSGKTVNIPLRKSTSIGIDGKPAKAEELSKGQKVQVHEESMKGRLVHTTINILK